MPELDRTFNFQLTYYGLGYRVVRPRRPGWIVGFRTHPISNTGTAGKNLGANAATVIAGVQWMLRWWPSYRPAPRLFCDHTAPAGERIYSDWID